MIHYETNLTVRYYECDPMGIVHHAEYVRYFECARDKMISEMGYSMQDCAADNIAFPVSSIDLKYHRPAKFDDVLRITAEIKEMPMARLKVHQQIFNQNGDLCVEGNITLGFLNTLTGRVMRCPEKLLNLFESINK